MSRLESKRTNIFRRKNRVRVTLKGVAGRPRLNVTISNKHISAQVIDDTKHETLLSVSSIGKNDKGTLKDKAVLVGKEIAKQAKAKKIKTVKLDRGPKLYHGRIKALADAAREEGLVI